MQRCRASLVQPCHAQRSTTTTPPTYHTQQQHQTQRTTPPTHQTQQQQQPFSSAEIDALLPQPDDERIWAASYPVGLLLLNAVRVVALNAPARTRHPRTPA
jgi:hypothetical protein